MILKTVLLNQPNIKNLFMDNQIKLNHRLSEIVNVLYMIGYILDFVERNANLQLSIKYISTIPFIINFIILFYLLFHKLKIKKMEGNHNVKIASVIFRLVLNLLFLLLILFFDTLWKSI